MGCNPSKADVTAVEEFDPVGVVPEAAKGPPKNFQKGDFHDAYELRCKLGQGAHGTVYSAYGPAGGKDGCLVAAKVVDLRKPRSESHRARQRLAVAKEAYVLQALPKSSHIVEFHGAFLAGGCAYFVMEQCEMGLWPAFQRMPAWTEEAFRPILMDMISGVRACHAACVVHRDIKPDNFLAVTTPTGGIVPKLCDFGLASTVLSAESNELYGICGTPPFLAPEVLGGERYNAKVDVWAMGALAHVLLFGRWPYMPKVMTVEGMKAAIRTGIPSPSFEPHTGMPKISTPCSAWVRSLLTRCVAKRPNSREALFDGNLAVGWDSIESLSPALEGAWQCGAFEAPMSEKTLTELDKHVAELNVAHNLRAGATRSTDLASDTMLELASAGTTMSAGLSQAADWSPAVSERRDGSKDTLPRSYRTNLDIVAR